MTAVDVIVPTYGETTIRTTVESVLEQRHAPASLTVINNAGPDPRPQLAGLEDHYDYIEMETNHGVCPAKNRGFRATASPHVLFLHPDDGLGPRFLEATSAALDDHPDAAFATVAGVRARDRVFEAELRALPEDPPVTVRRRAGRALLDLLVTRPGFFVPSMTLMRRAHLDVPAQGDGPWDVRLWSGHDFHLYQQLAARHAGLVVDAPLGVYRLHDQALSTDKPLMWRDRVASMEILRSEDPVVAADAERCRVLEHVGNAANRRLALALHRSGEQTEARSIARRRAVLTREVKDGAVALAVSLPGALGRAAVRRLGGATTAASPAQQLEGA